MPIYEYQCEKCQHQLEALQKISEDPLRKCPACKKMGLRKLVSASAFRLKGGGWYETDFKSGNKKNLVADGTSGDSKPTTDSSFSSSGSGDAASQSSGSKDSTSKASTKKAAASGTKST